MIHALPQLLAALAPNEWLVLAVGVALIGLINWYFFFAGKSETSATAGGNVQQATVLVRGGYEPQVVRVKAGSPVRLVFDRRETGSCSEEIVFPDFGIKRFLPANQKTLIELTPPSPGTYEFACGMNMLRGQIVAE
jgi:plastocyanin domain-containing protein